MVKIEIEKQQIEWRRWGVLQHALENAMKDLGYKGIKFDIHENDDNLVINITND